MLTGSDDYKQGLSAVREGAQDYLEKRRVNAGMLSRIVSYSVERNNFHRDLVRATRRYQDLFNNVPVALFTANQDGALKTANAACVKLLSCKGMPLDGVNFLDLLFEPPATRPVPRPARGNVRWNTGRRRFRTARAAS